MCHPGAREPPGSARWGPWRHRATKKALDPRHRDQGPSRRIRDPYSMATSCHLGTSRSGDALGRAFLLGVPGLHWPCAPGQRTLWLRTAAWHQAWAPGSPWVGTSRQTPGRVLLRRQCGGGCECGWVSQYLKETSPHPLPSPCPGDPISSSKASTFRDLSGDPQKDPEGWSRNHYWRHLGRRGDSRGGRARAPHGRSRRAQEGVKVMNASAVAATCEWPIQAQLQGAGRQASALCCMTHQR